MSATVIIEKIFDDRINTVSLSVEEPSGTPKSWASVDHMVLNLIDRDGVIATQEFDPATQVDFSTDGILVFTLGGESIPIGRYRVALVAVSAGGAKTQVVNWDRDHVQFEFLDTETIT